MNRRAFLIVFLILLFIGIVLIPTTYFISNRIVYSHEIKVNISSYGGVSIAINPEYGKIIINGTINGSARVYLINEHTLKEKYLGNFSGKIYLNTYDSGYTTLFMLGNLYPSKVDLSVRIYNSSFAPTGYTVSGLLLALSSIFGLYSTKLTDKSIKRKKI